MKTGAVRLLLAGATALSAACTSVRVTEADMLRPRPGAALTAEAAAAAGYRLAPLDIPTTGGVRLRGGLLLQPGASVTVVFFGGNIATAARTGLRRARELAALRVNVALVDYRGYGASDAGPMSAAALLGDGLAVFDAIADHPEIDRDRLVVHGHSMGSLVAAHVAARRATAGVVLESSVTTTADFARQRVPVAARPFVRIEIDAPLREQGNLAAVPRIEEPLLVIVGQDDSETPPKFSRRLYDASPLPAGRKRLVVVPQAGHDDVFARADALAAYRGFLADLGRDAGPR